jgi:hypothetical protein
MERELIKQLAELNDKYLELMAENERIKAEVAIQLSLSLSKLNNEYITISNMKEFTNHFKDGYGAAVADLGMIIKVNN